MEYLMLKRFSKEDQIKLKDLVDNESYNLAFRFVKSKYDLVSVKHLMFLILRYDKGKPYSTIRNASNKRLQALYSFSELGLLRFLKEVESFKRLYGSHL